MSRRQSPTRSIDGVESTMMAPGAAAIHQASAIWLRLSLTSRPSEVGGGCAPSPRTLGPVSSRVISGKPIVIWMISTPAMFGSIWRR